MLCNCDKPWTLKQSKTEKNRGRVYFSCWSLTCPYFQWLDTPWNHKILVFTLEKLNPPLQHSWYPGIEPRLLLTNQRRNRTLCHVDITRTSSVEDRSRTHPKHRSPFKWLVAWPSAILTMNNFTFNDSHYLQIHGTAMGTKMVPSFANLFLGLFEKNALRNASFQPHTWLRYIDDIFMIWTESPENLKIFFNFHCR